MLEPGAKDGRLCHRAAVRMFGLRGFGKTAQRPRYILPPDPGNTEVVERGSITGNDLKRAFEAANGIVQPTLFQEHQTEIVLCLRMSRLQGDGTPIRLRGFIQPPLFFQHDAEIVVRLGMIGVERQDPLIGGLRV